MCIRDRREYSGANPASVATSVARKVATRGGSRIPKVGPAIRVFARFSTPAQFVYESAQFEAAFYNATGLSFVQFATWLGVQFADDVSSEGSSRALSGMLQSLKWAWNALDPSIALDPLAYSLPHQLWPFLLGIEYRKGGNNE